MKNLSVREKVRACTAIRGKVNVHLRLTQTQDMAKKLKDVRRSAWAHPAEAGSDISRINASERQSLGKIRSSRI
jgi:hypothetical protein